MRNGDIDLHNLLIADFEAGKLYWKERPLEGFKNPIKGKTWNSRYANTEAFTSTSKLGYKSGCINKKIYYSHRVLWKMYTGEWPKYIDHIDGDPSNNSISNLREVTHHQNMFNQSSTRGSTCHYKGVSWNTKRKVWVAQIMFNRVQNRLGDFKCPTKAAMVYDKAAKEYFSNHAKLNFN